MWSPEEGSGDGVWTALAARLRRRGLDAATVAEGPLGPTVRFGGFRLAALVLAAVSTKARQ